MSEPATTLTPAEWALYDELCTPQNLQRLSEHRNHEPWTLLRQIQELTTRLHESRQIHYVHRPEKNWAHNNAWLSLRNEGIFNLERSTIVYTMRGGDVLLVARHWDRDIFVTHTPRHETVCGYMLAGPHEEMVGLFLPLFDKETILSAIRIRREKDTILQEKWLEEECRFW